MKLHELAHARTGDKGDVSNISVIAYRDEDWPMLEAVLTPDRLFDHFGPGFSGEIQRYVLPQLRALNFVIRGALSGGVTRSLAIDSHGKCLASVLLDLEFDAPGLESHATAAEDQNRSGVARSRRWSAGS